MQDTAFEWFLKNIPERFKNAFHTTCQEEIQKTRELERTQTENAFDMGRDETTRKFVEDGDDYFSKKFTQSEPAEKKICQEKVNGICPHHNLFCRYPDCEK